MSRVQQDKTLVFKFDNDIPLGRLVGLEIRWVCFSFSEIRLIFDDCSEIFLLNSDVFLNDNSSIFRNEMKNLIELVGKKLNSVDILSPSLSVFRMSGGYNLDFIDRDGDFENFRFFMDGLEYTV